MKKQLALSSTLALAIFALFLALMENTNSSLSQDGSAHRKTFEHALSVELQWIDLADQARFELVQDTLQYHLGRMNFLASKQLSELDFCCEDESMRLAHWAGGAYSLSLKFLFPTETSRNRALDAVLKEGFATLDIQPTNLWEAKGSANIALPIPGRNGQLLAIQKAQIKFSSHVELSQFRG